MGIYQLLIDYELNQGLSEYLQAFLQHNSSFEKLGITNISLHKFVNSTCQFPTHGIEYWVVLYNIYQYYS